MKSFIVLAVLVAAALAAPAAPGSEAEAPVLDNSNDNIGTGDYNYSYKTGNGIEAKESGALKNRGTENEALEVRGAYSYPGPDGVLYALSYIANELGFQPSAPYIPTSP